MPTWLALFSGILIGVLMVTTAIKVVIRLAEKQAKWIESLGEIVVWQDKIAFWKQDNVLYSTRINSEGIPEWKKAEPINADTVSVEDLPMLLEITEYFKTKENA